MITKLYLLESRLPVQVISFAKEGLSASCTLVMLLLSIFQKEAFQVSFRKISFFARVKISKPLPHLTAVLRPLVWNSAKSFHPQYSLRTCLLFLISIVWLSRRLQPLKLAASNSFYSTASHLLLATRVSESVKGTDNY